MDDKPKCKLSNTDGNVFSIIGIVCRALKSQPYKAAEFKGRAMNAESYGKVLQMVFEYVEVE